MVFLNVSYWSPVNWLFLAKEHLVRPVFVEKLRNTSVKEGNKLEMNVKARGNPNPDIVWLKNSDIIVAHKYPNIK